MTTHNKRKRKHKCTLCTSKLYQVSDLSYHLKTQHVLQEKVKCPSCDKCNRPNITQLDHSMKKTSLLIIYSQRRLPHRAHRHVREQEQQGLQFEEQIENSKEENPSLFSYIYSLPVLIILSTDIQTTGTRQPPKTRHTDTPRISRKYPRKCICSDSRYRCPRGNDGGYG